MSSTAAMYEVCGGTLNSNIPGMKDGAGAQLCAAQLNLTKPAGLNNAAAAAEAPFISPQWDLIASCFTKYEVKRKKFHYYPQCATTETNRMVFAYASDPNHPSIWAAAPSQALLESLAESIPFSPWAAWQMDVTNVGLSKAEYFTYDALAAAVGTSASSYLERFASFGSIGCLASDADAGAVYGLIYLELEIELFEFCPVSVTRPALREALMRALSRHQKEPQRINSAKPTSAQTLVGLERILGSGGSSSITQHRTTTDLDQREEEEEELEEYLARKTSAFEAEMRAELADRWNLSFALKGKGKVIPNTHGDFEILDESRITEPKPRKEEDSVEQPVVSRLLVGERGPVSPPSPTVDSMSDSELAREFMRRRLAARSCDSPADSLPSSP